MHLFTQIHRRSLTRKFLLLVLVSSPALSAADLAQEEIITQMRRVADWQIANPSKLEISDGKQAAFYLGLWNLYQVSSERKYAEAVTGPGKSLSHGPGPRVLHAEDHAVLQTWLELYRGDGDMEKLKPAISLFGKMTAELAGQSPKALSGGTFTWCWSDALYLSPPVWASLSNLTGNPKFLDWADREWWTTTDVLYDPTHSLFYGDNRFFNNRGESGKKVFGSRGNGHVVAGLVHMLDYLPEDHPSRGKYLGLYHDMMNAVVKLQNEDGLWRASLLDSTGEGGESSGSAFFTYAMAWGVNRGLLPGETFRPAISKGYQALVKNIQPAGMLGSVEQVGDSSEKQTAGADSSGAHGSGAFLLAGSEMVRGLDPSKRRNDVASFQGVVLPEQFLRSTPRTSARYVPERADDFAWENDLVAFRTYGPALRSSPENSGIDCWFKRVPYPVMDKWYIGDQMKLEYARVSKSYHEDHGEGYDAYKVGDTRGCGGISAWADGQLHNSETYISQRVIENTPQRVVFELNYASDLNGKTLRETKRISLVMGQRFFQSDSKFTLDGQAAAGLDVAIGLMPQVKGSTPDFSPESGTMRIWEPFDGNGLGTAVAIDPARVIQMISHTDPAGQTQALCLAKTDGDGAIRWFSGFGWAGQGEITSAEKWADYLRTFAGKFVKAPYVDFTKDPSFHVHGLPVPGAAAQPSAE